MPPPLRAREACHGVRQEKQPPRSAAPARSRRLLASARAPASTCRSGNSRRRSMPARTRTATPSSSGREPSVDHELEKSRFPKRQIRRLRCFEDAINEGSRLHFTRGNDADCRSDSALMRIKSASHERHRNRGADRLSWTLVNGLACCSAEDARLVPGADSCAAALTVG